MGRRQYDGGSDAETLHKPKSGSKHGSAQTSRGEDEESETRRKSDALKVFEGTADAKPSASSKVFEVGARKLLEVRTRKTPRPPLQKRRQIGCRCTAAWNRHRDKFST